MSETTPEPTAAPTAPELAENQEAATANEPTTSPDVEVTNDPDATQPVTPEAPGSDGNVVAVETEEDENA